MSQQVSKFRGLPLLQYGQPGLSPRPDHALTSVDEGHLVVWLQRYGRVKIGQGDLEQGIVDGSASKPALRQDTGYMVEKTYHDIAP